MNHSNRFPGDERTNVPGRLSPEDIRAMVSRIQSENRYPARTNIPASGATRESASTTPRDLLDQYFDGELDAVGKAALNGHLQRDPTLRAECEETRESLKLLRATPGLRDRTEPILAEVDRQRRFMLRSARLRVWGVRAALAASLAMAAGGAIWAERAHPIFFDGASPTPLATLENAGRNDAADGLASAVNATKGVVRAVASPLGTNRLADGSSVQTSKPTNRATPKLAMNGKSGEPRSVWTTVAAGEISSPSGSGRTGATLRKQDWQGVSAHAGLLASAVPDVRVLRCDWEPDSALRFREDESLSRGSAAQGSWWLKAWIESTSGYTPGDAMARR